MLELIRSISDPEHRSMTLEQLAVVSAPQITFDPKYPDRITVEFTPTVPHCGMSTFIGTPRGMLGSSRLTSVSLAQVCQSACVYSGASRGGSRSTYASSRARIRANMRVSPPNQPRHNQIELTMANTFLSEFTKRILSLVKSTVQSPVRLSMLSKRRRP